MLDSEYWISDSKYLTIEGVINAVEKITGDRPHPATVYRWIQGGMGGVRLQSTKFGKRRLVKAEWLIDFFDSVTQSQLSQGEGGDE